MTIWLSEVVEMTTERNNSTSSIDNCNCAATYTGLYINEGNMSSVKTFTENCFSQENVITVHPM